MSGLSLSGGSAVQGGILLAPGEGTPLQFGPDEHFVWKATGATTNDVLDICELTALPHAGPPTHIHWRTDECFYILEGTFMIEAGDRRIIAPAGAFVFVPRGMAHAWHNISTEPGRMLLTFTPGGAKRYFEDLAPLLDGPVEDERLLPILHTRRGACRFTTDRVALPASALTALLTPVLPLLLSCAGYAPYQNNIGAERRQRPGCAATPGSAPARERMRYSLWRLVPRSSRQWSPPGSGLLQAPMKGT